MKKAFTIVESLITIFFLGLFIFIVYCFVGASCSNSIDYDYGKNLQLLSEERTFPTKYHYKDIDTGQCYYSFYRSSGSVLYKEECRK